MLMGRMVVRGIPDSIGQIGSTIATLTFDREGSMRTAYAAHLHAMAQVGL